MEKLKSTTAVTEEIIEERDLHAELAEIEEIKKQINALSTTPTQCPQPGQIQRRPDIQIPSDAMSRQPNNNSILNNNIDFCEACQELEAADNLFINGLGAAECLSFFNNRGLGLDAAETNCESLQKMVDCLIGQHKKRLEITNFCDIKDWLEQLMANIWNIKSALICDSCGQWHQIQLLWRQAAEIWEQIRAIWSELMRIKTEILDLIECIRNELNARITREVERLDGRIDETNIRIDATNVRLTNEVNRLDGRVDTTNVRIDETNVRITNEVNQLNTRIDQIDNRVIRLENDNLEN